MKEGSFPELEGVFHSEVSLRLERDGGFRLKVECLAQPDGVFRVTVALTELVHSTQRLINAMRTQKGDRVTAHLTDSREIFLHLVDKVRSWDRKLEQQIVDARDYEALELAVMRHLMGIKVILFHFHSEHTDETVSS